MESLIDPITGGLKFVEIANASENTAQKNANINDQFQPKTSKLSLDDRVKLCLEVGEECINEKDLRERLEKKVLPVCYDGFEPSGRMHIAQGILKCINVNKLVDAGCIFVFWVADWFALMNNKLGGDIDKIKTVGRYFVEIWKAAGMKLHNVKFLWASDEINARSEEYWTRVIDIARRNNINRIKRCATIMGRNEEDDLQVSQLLYPCMQCTDIFFLGADICQLGMDQRKVNMLAREYCDDAGIKDKPIILSHHMLGGLKEGQLKMSKSDPMSAIFMEDTEEDVKAKINGAFCPEKKIDGNPCLEYVRYIVFGSLGEFNIERPEKYGGNKRYATFEELSEDYAAGNLHPGDLKPALAKAINKIIQPVRDHFTNDPEARKLFEQVKEYRTTKASDAPAKK
jgi:tyrosyl-tRNA synthetase